MWWSAIPKAIDKGLGVIKTLLNPEDTRKRKLFSLRREERALQRSIGKKIAQKKRNPVELGADIDELVRVRKEIDRYTR